MTDTMITKTDKSYSLPRYSHRDVEIPIANVIPQTRLGTYSSSPCSNASHSHYHDDDFTINTKEILKTTKLASSQACKSKSQPHISSPNTACVLRRVETPHNTYPPNRYPPNTHSLNTDPESEPLSPNFNIDELWSLVRLSRPVTNFGMDIETITSETMNNVMEQNFRQANESLDKTTGGPGALEYESSLTLETAEEIMNDFETSRAGGRRLKLIGDVYNRVIKPLNKRPVFTVSSSSGMAHESSSATSASSFQTPGVALYQITEVGHSKSTVYEAISVGMDVHKTCCTTLLPIQVKYCQHLIADRLCESRINEGEPIPFAANFLTILYSWKRDTDEKTLQDAWEGKARQALTKQLSMPRHDLSVDVKKAKLNILRHFGFLFYGNRQALVEVWEMKYNPVEAKASQLPRSTISTKSGVYLQKSRTEQLPRQQTQKPNPAGPSKIRASSQKPQANYPPTAHFQSRCLGKWDITDSGHILELASFSAKVYKWGHYEFLKDYADSLSSILRPLKGARSLPHELWTASEMWAYWQCAASSSVTDGSHITAGQDARIHSNPRAANTTVPGAEQDDAVASESSATNTADTPAKQRHSVPSNPFAPNTTTESSSFTHDTAGVEDGQSDPGNWEM